MAQTVIPTGAVAASLVGAPAVARAMPAIARDALFNPLGTGLSIGGGAAGGWLVNKATQALTGKTYGEKLGELTNSSPVLAAMTNPGMLAGGLYGGFVGNNYANLGRYTLNYMYPASYGRRQFLTIPKIYTKPLYKAPPTFYNGRKPEWYDEYTRMRGVEEAEARFQNGAK